MRTLDKTYYNTYIGVSYAQRTRTDFLSLGAPRKSRSEGPIFSRTESAHTTDFLSQTGPRKNRTDFFSDQKLTHTDRFLSELLCVTIIGDVPLLDDVTPIFSRTEVSAHGTIFCRKQLREKIGAILYRSKSQRTRTDFHSDFLSSTKNRSVCAGH